MKHNKEEIEKVVQNIIEEKIVNCAEDFMLELADKVKGQSGTEAIVTAMMEFYIGSVLNLKLVLIESLYKLLNNEE